MKLALKNAPTKRLEQYLEELEHKYANAFAKEADKASLKAIFETIKRIRTELAKRKEGVA